MAINKMTMAIMMCGIAITMTDDDDDENEECGGDQEDDDDDDSDDMKDIRLVNFRYRSTKRVEESIQSMRISVELAKLVVSLQSSVLTLHNPTPNCKSTANPLFVPHPLIYPSDTVLL